MGMATYVSLDLNSKPIHLGEFGDATLPCGSVTPTANIATADVVRICKIPAGFEVNAVLLAWANQGTTVPADVGYAPVSSNDGPLAAAQTGFAAALAMGGGASNGVWLGNFDPIKFEQDAFLTLTIGAVTAGAAGAIRGTCLGTGKGVK